MVIGAGAAFIAAGLLAVESPVLAIAPALIVVVEVAIARASDRRANPGG